MAYSHITVALSAPTGLLKRDPASEEDVLAVVNETYTDKKRFLDTTSRNANNIWYLERICAHREAQLRIFLLDHYRLMRGSEITEALAEIEAFFEELTQKPSIVIEATRTRHQPEVDVSCNGVHGSIRMELVQEGYKRKENGWLYWYDEQEIHEALIRALSCADLSDYFCKCDAEGLEYALAFVAVHRPLLELAHEHGETFIYAQYKDGFFPAEKGG